MKTRLFDRQIIGVFLLACTLFPNLAEAQFDQRSAYLDSETFRVYADGVDVEGLGVFDIELVLNSETNQLDVVAAREANTINPNNRYDAATQTLVIDSLAVNADTFWVDMVMTTLNQSNENSIATFQVRDVGVTVDPRYHERWIFDYENNIPSDSAILTFTDAQISGQDASITVQRGQIDLSAFTDAWTGTAQAESWFAGVFNDVVNFTATPVDTTTDIFLGVEDRFGLSVDWFEDGVERDAQAVRTGVDSARIIFSNPAEPDLAIRILDNCNETGHFSFHAKPFGATATNTLSLMTYTIDATDLTFAKSPDPAHFNDTMADEQGNIIDLLAFPCE